MTLKIGIVVGEPSGDLLASKLIAEIRDIIPDCLIEGIAGQNMINAGCIQLFHMSELSVMGFWEPLKRLPRILSIRKKLIEYFEHNTPDIFIGVDAPDFNLPLEKKLKKYGITTVHFVSPSVWAWRKGRIKFMQKSLNLMLALFPFETEIYTKAKIPVICTGHPLADDIPFVIDKTAAKEKLKFTTQDLVIGLLPGSRNQEIIKMTPVYLETMRLLHELNNDFKFVMPLINEDHKVYVLELKKTICHDCPLTIVINNSSLAISSMDYAIATSGTVTLELMLHKVPMIVAYKANWLTYIIFKNFIKLKNIALPNIISKKQLVDECLQQDANPNELFHKLTTLMQDQDRLHYIKQEFDLVHRELCRNASKVAAQAIMDLSYAK